MRSADITREGLPEPTQNPAVIIIGGKSPSAPRFNLTSNELPFARVHGARTFTWLAGGSDPATSDGKSSLQAKLFHPYILHSNARSGGACQRTIRGEKSRIVEPSDGHIERVVSADVVAMLPGLLDER